MINLRLIPTDEVKSIWPVAGPMVARALAFCNGETTIDAIRNNLFEGHTRLLMVEEEGEAILAVVLSIMQYPAKRVLQVSYAGGKDIEKWIDTGMPVIEKIAGELGADAVYVMGRKGWIKRLAKHGYTVYSTLIGKEIGGNRNGR